MNSEQVAQVPKQAKKSKIRKPIMIGGQDGDRFMTVQEQSDFKAPNEPDPNIKGRKKKRQVGRQYLNEGITNFKRAYGAKTIAEVQGIEQTNAALKDYIDSVVSSRLTSNKDMLIALGVKFIKSQGKGYSALSPSEKRRILVEALLDDPPTMIGGSLTQTQVMDHRRANNELKPSVVIPEPKGHASKLPGHLLTSIATALAPDPRVKAIIAGLDTVFSMAPKISRGISNAFGHLGKIHKNNQNAANFDYIKFAVDPDVDQNIHNMKPNNVPWAFARARSVIQFDVVTQGPSFAFACAPFSCCKDKSSYTGKDWTDMPFAIYNSNYTVDNPRFSMDNQTAVIDGPFSGWAQNIRAFSIQRCIMRFIPTANALQSQGMVQPTVWYQQPNGSWQPTSDSWNQGQIITYTNYINHKPHRIYRLNNLSPTPTPFGSVIPNDPFGIVAIQAPGTSNLLLTALFTGMPANTAIGVIEIDMSIQYIPIDAVQKYVDANIVETSPSTGNVIKTLKQMYPGIEFAGSAIHNMLPKSGNDAQDFFKQLTKGYTAEQVTRAAEKHRLDPEYEEEEQTQYNVHEQKPTFTDQQKQAMRMAGGKSPFIKDIKETTPYSCFWDSIYVHCSKKNNGVSGATVLHNGHKITRKDNALYVNGTLISEPVQLELVKAMGYKPVNSYNYTTFKNGDLVYDQEVGHCGLFEYVMDDVKLQTIDQKSELGYTSSTLYTALDNLRFSQNRNTIKLGQVLLVLNPDGFDKFDQNDNMEKFTYPIQVHQLGQQISNALNKLGINFKVSPDGTSVSCQYKELPKTITFSNALQIYNLVSRSRQAHQIKYGDGFVRLSQLGIQLLNDDLQVLSSTNAKDFTLAEFFKYFSTISVQFNGEKMQILDYSDIKDMPIQ